MRGSSIVTSIRCLAITVLLLLLSSNSIGFATEINQQHDTLSITYSFSQPEIHSITTNGVCYDSIQLSETINGGMVGAPSLPAKGAYILLPPKKQVSDIIVNHDDLISLGTGFQLEPISTPVPLSQGLPDISLENIQDVSENQNQHFPHHSSHYSVVGTYTLRGFSILVLMLHPVQYDEQTGELTYVPHLTITVELKEDQRRTPSLFRNAHRDSLHVTQLVDNPEIVTQYHRESKPVNADNEATYMIITSDELKTYFEPLKTANEEQGLQTAIVSLDEINCSTAMELRNFIRTGYLDRGVDYVLLGGDVDVVPAQYLFVRAWEGSGYATQTPADIYYGCLDGTFNSDNDERWGEPTDGENGGDVDLLAELFVGRASVDTPEEAQIFVKKTLTSTYYMGPQLKKVLLVGEHLWSGPTTWGGDYMDELVDGSNANDYSTVGIPSSTYAFEKLYDKHKYWSTDTLIDYMDNDVQIINHLGHSSYGYNMKLHNPLVNLLENKQTYFLYSQGCNAGGFDVEDCAAEYFTVKHHAGAHAAIMNARYGWGMKGSTNGPSQHYHREFWDAIFGEQKHSFGMANQDSKEDNLWRINWPCMRWCCYELNLFGDPALELNTQYERADLEIVDIQGGFCSISAEIKNTALVPAHHINWKITITGGLSGRIDRILNRFYVPTEGTIQPFSSETVYASTVKPVVGFGNLKIHVEAEIPTVKTVTQSAHAVALGPFILIQS